MILQSRSFLPLKPDEESDRHIVPDTKTSTEYKLSKQTINKKKKIFQLTMKTLLDMYGLTVVKLKRRIASYDVLVENIFVIERIGSVI